VLNSTGLLTQKKKILRFKNALLRQHPWVRPFTFPSSRFPRSTRYLSLFAEAMTIMFLEALSYTVLYPDNGFCQRYSLTSEQECLKQTSRSDRNSFDPTSPHSLTHSLTALR
jgi:hypothetical protein